MSIRIERMSYGGAGVDATGTIAVPFTLPGELVDPASLAILEPSPHRVAPRCPHFGSCGGCQYQHADYAGQLQIKQAILLEVLGDLPGLPALQVLGAEPWGYRNRVRLRAELVEGRLRVGYNRRGTVEFLPIRECPIAAPVLLRAAEAVLAALDAGWQRELTEMELFASADAGRLQLTLFVRSERGLSLPKVCGRLSQGLPELAGVGVVVVGVSGKQSRPGTHWGADGLQYRAAGHDYWVPRGSFFQVNRFLVDELVRLVTAGRSGALAWDLYAGVGLFTRALAANFVEVTSVEVAAPAGGTTIPCTVAEFLRRAVLQRERPELIVVDPPRAGLGAEVCALLARVKAAELVYVSCDPTTLALDLKALVDSGYTIGALHLVDLFPQTYHLEAVVMLHR